MNPPTLPTELLAVQWKEIPDYPAYEVSTAGEIRNKKSGQLRVLDLNSRGYYRIRVQVKGDYHRLMAHRCVAKAFIPNPLNKSCVDHIDGNPKNNRLENLRWTTHSENMLNQKMRTNKMHTKFKNIVKQGSKYRWKITINNTIHRSEGTFEKEEDAHKDFIEKVKSLSEFISFPVPIVQTSA